MPLNSVPKPDGIEAAQAHPSAATQILSVNLPDAPAVAGTDQDRLVRGASTVPLGAGAAGVASVIGADERTRILATNLAPYAIICSLDIKAPWGDFVGTGWFIGKRTIITAGHCVYHPTEMGGWAKSITVRPGRNENASLGQATSCKFSTTDAWKATQNKDFDMAAIHLDADLLPAGMAPFRVGSLTDDQLNTRFVNVSGYPGDKGGKQQWWAKNRIRAVRPLRIFYDVDTMGGQSGAPAFIIGENDPSPIVVGIHAYGIGGTPNDLPLEVNSAPRITSDVLALFRQWVEQDTPGQTVLA
jgi:V8-like Glu-specific endopeptidase